MKIEITDRPLSLAALEALCATARQQGFPDTAYVDAEGRTLTLRTEPDALLFAPAAVASGGLCDSRGPRIGEDVPRCRQPVGHDGPHRPDESDGFGAALTWGDL